MTLGYWREVNLDGRLCFTVPQKKLFQIKKKTTLETQCATGPIFMTQVS